jgi:hypothetical protein
MNKQDYDLWTERLGLAICIWLCTLPVVFLAAILFRNIHFGWIGAVIFFVIIFLACIGICTWRVLGDDKSRII